MGDNTEMGTLAVTEGLHAKQQEAARKEAERTARKAPQDAAADAKGEARAGRALQMMPHQESASETDPRSIHDPGGQHHWGGQRCCSKRLVQCGECVELRSIRGTAGPGGDRHQEARRAAARGPGELGCGENTGNGRFGDR
jgi:hypothetical protein